MHCPYPYDRQSKAIDVPPQLRKSRRDSASTIGSVRGREGSSQRVNLFSFEAERDNSTGILRVSSAFPPSLVCFDSTRRFQATSSADRDRLS
jgi:hypothetical protein